MYIKTYYYVMVFIAMRTYRRLKKKRKKKRG